MGGDNELQQKSWQYVMITSQNRPDLPDFLRVTLKNMGRSGDEAMHDHNNNIIVGCSSTTNRMHIFLLLQVHIFVVTVLWCSITDTNCKTLTVFLR